MPRNEYEKSPRQRLEWFGNDTNFSAVTSEDNNDTTHEGRILVHPVRLAFTGGEVEDPAFPAGIVRGETCSIARFIGHLSVYDRDRREQNVSYSVGAGLIKQRVEDELIADPGNTDVSEMPDPLKDRRASWIWHAQETWNPQSAGANYTVFKWDSAIDTTNSRIFESNDVLRVALDVKTRINSGEAVELNLRVVLLWRCLLRLD